MERIKKESLDESSKKIAHEKFVIRLPEGMRLKIQGLAHHSHRSMNSEIVARLEHSFDFFSDHLIDAVEIAPAQDLKLKPIISTIDGRLASKISRLSEPKKKALLAFLS